MLQLSEAAGEGVGGGESAVERSVAGCGWRGTAVQSTDSVHFPIEMKSLLIYSAVSIATFLSESFIPIKF
jgi:hypothetical protein